MQWSRCREQKLNQISFWKYFFVNILSCVYFYITFKKVFSKTYLFSFCSLHLDHCISSKYCHHVLCSTDRKESNGNNYTVIGHSKKFYGRRKLALLFHQKVEWIKGKIMTKIRLFLAKFLTSELSRKFSRRLTDMFWVCKIFSYIRRTQRTLN